MDIEQNFSEFYTSHAGTFKASEGYLVVDKNDHVTIKTAYDDSDTVAFLTLNYTCTAVVLITLHKGQFGSIIWDQNQLLFRPETITAQSPPPFGGIYLTRDFKTFGYNNHDFSYSHHVIAINKIFLSWQNDHFVLDDKKPLRFTVENKFQSGKADQVTIETIIVIFGLFIIIMGLIRIWS